MLKLLIGTDWKANSAEIMRQVADKVKARQGNCILLVPELISHETERRLCATAGDTSSRYAQVLSFTRLAKRVADTVGHNAPECMDNGGRVVAMASAARQLHSRLKAYAAVETKPEFLLGMLDAVDEFKRCCIRPADLAAASKQAEGVLAQKLEELALLLEAYDSICAQGKRDPRDQMDWLLAQLRDSEYVQNHTFFIDGFPDFTIQHMAILSHIIRFCPEVVISINCDSVGSDSIAYEKAGQTAFHILQEAKRYHIPFEIISVSPQSCPVNGIWKNLLQGNYEDSSKVLQVMQPQTAYEECVLAADHILDLVENGARFRDIRLVCPDLAGYQSALDLVFRRCNIPVYISGKDNILTKSVVHTVLSALDAVISGFEQKQVFRYLKSALSPLSLEQCDLLENYAYVWSVSGKQWLCTWDKHPDGLSGRWTDDTAIMLEQLNEYKNIAITPLKRLDDAIKRSLQLSDILQGLYVFMDETLIAQRLESLADEMLRSADNRNYQILNQLWQTLLDALKQLEDVLGDTAWDADTFVRLLKLLLGQYDIGTIPAVLDAVAVGDVSTMRCQSGDYLIVLGALEGNLPKFADGGGVLTDTERTALRKLGVPLSGGAMDGLQIELSEITAVFCGAHKNVLVTCPSGQPSLVFKRLCQMAGGTSDIPISLGSARTNAMEAGALLARLGNENAARELGLDDEYSKVIANQTRDLGSVCPENVKKIYGETVRWSASQIDRLADCRLHYFFEYGLKARERKIATIDPAEFGSYVHAVLEEVVREVMELGGFHSVEFEKIVELAASATQRYVAKQFSQLDSKRIAYLFERNGRELQFILREVWEELRQSQFQPIAVELNFGRGGEMDAISVSGNTMQAELGGFVDRVDAWDNQGKTYFRVVDYKTGKKKFDYCDVLNGIGLQMLLYLFALEDAGDPVLGENRVPTGVMYFPARAPILPANSQLTDDQVKKLRAAEWKRKGLLRNDPDILKAMEPSEGFTRLSCTMNNSGEIGGDVASKEQFRLLKSYVYKVLQDMLNDVSSGSITPNPYTRGSSHDACRYCPYKNVCLQLDITQRRNFKTVKAERFWEDIEKEMNSRGN